MPVIAKLYSRNGRSLSISGWAYFYGIDEKAIRSRLSMGWSVDKAIHEPIKPGYGTPGARKKALLFGEKIYEGKMHKKCGTKLKYTSNASCLQCSE